MVRPAVRPRSTDLNLSIFVHHDDETNTRGGGPVIKISIIRSVIILSYLRYWQVKKKCPKCDYQWSDDISSNMFNLKKVRED